LHAKETVSIGRLPRTLARQKGIGRTQHPKKASEAPSLTNAYAAVPTPRAEFLPSPTAPSHPAAHEVAPPAPKSRRTGRAPVIRDSPVPAATLTPQLAQKQTKGLPETTRPRAHAAASAQHFGRRPARRRLQQLQPQRRQHFSPLRHVAPGTASCLA